MGRRLVSALLAIAALAAAPRASAQGAPPSAVEAPRLVTEASVPYPERATGEATITLVLTISDDGHVIAAEPTESFEPFSSAAAEAARSWRFEPATRDGKPTPAKIRFEVVFRPPEVVSEPEPAPEATTPKPAEVSAAPKRKAAEGPIDVRVRGEHVEAARSATLSRTEVRQIPGTFGDPFRAIEVLPGVTPIVSGLPFFFIRGAPPGNVGYYLDGVRVPLLFHVGAGPSVVHPALIERVDLYPGGYPARFGRFAGGIVSGETGAPDTELHGEYNVRLFDAGAIAETGLLDNRATLLLGGRYSYTGLLLSLFSQDTTLQYWDYQARATYDVGPDDRLMLFGFGAYDFLGQKLPDGTNATVFGTQFHRLDSRWDHRLGDRGNVRLAVTLGQDESTATQNDRKTRDRIVGTRAEYTYQLGPRALLRAGTDLQLDTYEVLLVDPTQPLPASTQGILNLFPSRTDLAFATRADVVLQVLPRFEMTPGVRFDYYGSEGAAAVGIDPRLQMRTRITDRVSQLTALGIAHQPPSFVVPVPGFQPGGLKGGLQSAYQESTGVEVDLGQNTLATATVFHNAFYDMSDPLGATPQQVSGCPPGTYPSDTLAGDRVTQPTGNGGGCGRFRFVPGTVGPDRFGATAESTNAQRAAAAFETRSDGSAYGLELLLKRKLTSRFGGFFSYTLSRSTRTANGKTYVATFDRTHVLNLALAYDLGRGWRAGSRVTFYTGLPRTPDPTTTDTRLAPFFRLDLRLEKRWQLGQKAWISFVAEMMNATLSKESVSTTCTLQGCDETKVGPVSIPSLGVEGGF